MTNVKRMDEKQYEEHEIKHGADKAQADHGGHRRSGCEGIVDGVDKITHGTAEHFVISVADARLHII